jgi:hypothetical protein
VLVGTKYVALVDDEDYDTLMQYRWYCRNDTAVNTNYAYRNVDINGIPTTKSPGMFKVYMHKKVDVVNGLPI